MSHTVFCVKLKENLMGLDYPPYPGEFGKKIYHSVSKKAWDMWLNHQTMLINEYRLSLAESKSQLFLRQELEKFLLDSAQKPTGYVPVE